MAAASFYWYDLETSGTNPVHDRPLQFAGMRTDLDLNPVGVPDNFYCLPGDDTLPDPDAIAVTGITWSSLETNGLTEAAFCQRVMDIFAVPQTCVSGYNNIRFDDEFVRQMFYRNFHEPYAREWQQGNSRWDVIDLFRMAGALRPEGFNWPIAESGMPSFRLEA